MADMIPCRHCGHYDIVCDQEKEQLRAEVSELERQNERLESALQRIKQWSEAYPLDVFPEPDWKRSNEVLKAAGLSLDRISGSNMRHVVEGVGKIACSALNTGQSQQE